MQDEHALIAAAATVLRSHGAPAPQLAIVLGSGLGAWAHRIRGAHVVAYNTLPGFEASTVEGHHGNVVMGTHCGINVAVLQGRTHAYEGHSAVDVARPLRVLAELGARDVLLTNASGSVNPALQPADLMLIRDHLNLTGKNPLVGPNDARIGPRFPDMTGAYDGALRSHAREVAQAQSIALREGVYAGVLGPSYETPAEIAMLRALGADAVGMSTVLETIAARHAGMRVMGISCVTNFGAGLAAGPLRHTDVTAVAAEANTRFGSLIDAMLSTWPTRT